MTTSLARAETARPMPELRLLTWALLALPTFLVTGFSIILVSGIIKAGSYATLIHTPVDPKEVVPFGLHGWNPFAWLYYGVALALPLSFTVGALLALIGAGNLARPAVWAHRRTWTWLAAGVLCNALLIALLFAPITDQLHGWWAD